ncbi:MAG: polysaccharide biosynthesis/export family protein [Bacteroidales bacterium]|jgi:polysaccharide export outer membrane protein|nr:polysaccharide biosynthesis/export family protein [Bacteroidales bacterium]OJX91707.1 MAG: hypothetical protein BGP01_02465 [Paludibacter sp. 47-17]
MYKKQIRFLLFLMVVLHFASCITTERVNYLQKPGGTIPSYADSIRYEDYRLRVGDKLYVRVYSTHRETNELFNGGSIYQSTYMMQGNSAYSDLYSYTIQPDGTIVFPMIGAVQLKGLTLREATRTMEQSISPYLQRTDEPDAQFGSVDVRVVGRYFSVIGGGRTGYFPILREKITIFQALAMAGDIGLYGDRSKIRVIRESEAGTQVKMFDIRSKDILHSEYYYIEPNDVIYIQNLNEQFFSVSNFPSLLATTFSTISFGVFIYNLFTNQPATN